MTNISPIKNYQSISFQKSINNKAKETAPEKLTKEAATETVKIPTEVYLANIGGYIDVNTLRLLDAATRAAYCIDDSTIEAAIEKAKEQEALNHTNENLENADAATKAAYCIDDSTIEAAIEKTEKKANDNVETKTVNTKPRKTRLIEPTKIYLPNIGGYIDVNTLRLLDAATRAAYDLTESDVEAIIAANSTEVPIEDEEDLTDAATRAAYGL